ncbi:MAG: outer membrane lipoprotein carrier protein LolA [Betaproteobacteria bacterium]|nr:outer membrane lipoprotein carrier protein LolA [Betaproteobacteria bacterium]NBY14368.1 outer membrane lipoprotein carrier protein LolA [Betaproteobacteria bacterium]NCA16509.1 outer membrane lipoprotein carrier protein LolA [Betaproteobacteria bacterium]
MRRFARAALLALACAASTTSFSASPEVVPVVVGADAQLIAFLTSTQSLRAQFEHQQMNPSGRVMRFFGVVSAKRPGLFRWEVRKPYAQLQLIRDGELLLYDPDLAQLSIRRLDASVMGTPAGLFLLSGADAAQALETQFVVQNLEPREGLTWVSLRPRLPDSATQLIEVGLDAQGRLSRLEVTDALGRKSVVRLSQIEVNPVLPAALFSFKPPAGTEVLRPSQP